MAYKIFPYRSGARRVYVTSFPQRPGGSGNEAHLRGNTLLSVRGQAIWPRSKQHVAFMQAICTRAVHVWWWLMYERSRCSECITRCRGTHVLFCAATETVPPASIRPPPLLSTGFWLPRISGFVDDQHCHILVAVSTERMPHSVGHGVMGLVAHPGSPRWIPRAAGVSSFL